MRSILILVAFVVGMLCSSFASAQSLNASWVAGENAFEQECVNGVCTLKQQAPAASQSLPVPTKVERPVSQQPTPAEPQAACHTGYSSPQPVRSVAKAPLRFVGKLLGRVRDRKPLRSLAGWVFCR
jgi:hypothetical protein